MTDRKTFESNQQLSLPFTTEINAYSLEQKLCRRHLEAARPNKIINVFARADVACQKKESLLVFNSFNPV